MFGTDFGNLWDAKSLKLTLPPEYSNPFSYIVSKALMGVQNALVSIYPSLMHVSDLFIFIAKIASVQLNS